MCDYSLELYRSRQAVNDEHYTLHRFGTGTLGFIADGDCTTAICMPTGVRLRLEGLDKRLQRSLRVGATEEDRHDPPSLHKPYPPRWRAIRQRPRGDAAGPQRRTIRDVGAARPDRAFRSTEGGG